MSERIRKPGEDCLYYPIRETSIKVNKPIGSGVSIIKRLAAAIKLGFLSFLVGLLFDVIHFWHWMADFFDSPFKREYFHNDLGKYTFCSVCAGIVTATVGVVALGIYLIAFASGSFLFLILSPISMVCALLDGIAVGWNRGLDDLDVASYIKVDLVHLYPIPIRALFYIPAYCFRLATNIIFYSIYYAIEGIKFVCCHCDSVKKVDKKSAPPAHDDSTPEHSSVSEARTTGSEDHSDEGRKKSGKVTGRSPSRPSLTISVTHPDKPSETSPPQRQNVGYLMYAVPGTGGQPAEMGEPSLSALQGNHSPNGSKYSPTGSRHSPSGSKHSPSGSKHSPSHSGHSPQPRKNEVPSRMSRRQSQPIISVHSEASGSPPQKYSKRSRSVPHTSATNTHKRRKSRRITRRPMARGADEQTAPTHHSTRRTLALLPPSDSQAAPPPSRKQKRSSAFLGANADTTFGVRDQPSRPTTPEPSVVLPMSTDALKQPDANNCRFM